MIVGVDAAAQEIPTEPWVFAPALRTIRALDLQPYCEDAQNGTHRAEKQTLGLTYHVGEDFRHPLSGLRHTSEAITLFQMHSGDRLGHALALGIDLNRWFSGCGLTAVPRIERMENCIWAWKAISETPKEGEHLNFLQYLENRILKYAKDIYGTLNGITVEKLYHAYMCKALAHSELEQIAARVKSGAGLTAMDCFSCHGSSAFYPCAAEAQRNGQAWWSEDALSMSYHCDFYKSRMNEIVIEEPTAEETAITHRMQSYVRRQAASVGLIVESNPSSNATIGEMNGILNHPLLTMRTQSNDAPAVMISVNTDDPSLFNASVPNEYAYIYFALLHNGHTVEQALEEINQLRAIGLHSSFIKEIPTFENLLNEYEKVLYSLL